MVSRKILNRANRVDSIEHQIVTLTPVISTKRNRLVNRAAELPVRDCLHTYHDGAAVQLTYFPGGVELKNSTFVSVNYGRSNSDTINTPSASI